MKFVSNSLAETDKFANRFLRDLMPQKNRATVVGLYGDLGSGKTTFVQGVGRALGITDSMQSPTFVIEKRYKIYDLRFKNLIHIDAYRLEKWEELKKLGFDELLSDSENLIIVEWADKVADILPKDHIKIFCRFVDEGTREFRLEQK